MKTVSGVTIAPAEEGDREWCARLMAGSEPWLTLGRALEACRALCGDPQYELFVAREDDQPLSFLLCHPHGAMSSPYIASIAVAEEARGHGLGTRMLAFAEEHYRLRARHLFLCVSSFNPRARRLYERLGYQAIAELTDYIVPGASEILMHKRLA